MKAIVGIVLLCVAAAMGLFGVWAWALGIGWSEPVWSAYSWTTVALALGGVGLVITDGPS